MRLRFSLRTLLFVTTLIAIVSAWFIRPTLLAQRFIHTMEAGNYSAADRMIDRPAETIEWKTINARKRGSFIPNCQLVLPTFAELIRGQRVVHVTIGTPYYLDGGPQPVKFLDGLPVFVEPPPPPEPYELEIVATISGHLRYKNNKPY